MMKKVIILLLATAFTGLAASADAYSYLRINKTGGDVVAYSVEGLKITFDGNGNAVVVNSDNTAATLALADIATLEFSNEAVEPEPEPDPEPIKGDVNNDGVVNATDIGCIVNVISGTESAETYEGRADVNEDEVVNATDISGVVNIIAGLESEE